MSARRARRVRMLRKNISNINNLIIVIILIVITYLVLVMTLGANFISPTSDGFLERAIAYGIAFLAFLGVLYATMRLRSITRGLSLDVNSELA
jgi:arginine exporter protein ArgO